MRFKEWVEKHYSTFSAKLAVIDSELVSSGALVDVDYSGSNLNVGLNKGSSVATLSAASKGRCRIYINESDYDGMKFPVVVFVNLRASYQDAVTGKSIPSVVNSVNILFELYRENTVRKTDKQVVLAKKPDVIDRVLLVNEARSWFSKLRPVTASSNSEYFREKGIKYSHILDDSDLGIREGYSAKYGRFDAIPLRYPHQDAFEGFQRIYADGSKIMMRGFNPNGLCAYFPSDENAKNPENVKTVILKEGVANSLMAYQMAKEMKLQNVVVMSALYVDNILLVIENIKDKFVNAERFLLIYDNDTNGYSEKIANKAKEILPELKTDKFELNDICDVVKFKGYGTGKNAFKKILRTAFA